MAAFETSGFMNAEGGPISADNLRYNTATPYRFRRQSRTWAGNSTVSWRRPTALNALYSSRKARGPEELGSISVVDPVAGHTLHLGRPTPSIPRGRTEKIYRSGLRYAHATLNAKFSSGAFT